MATIATTMPISPGVTDLTEPVKALLTSLPDPASAIRFFGRLRQESPAGFARIYSPGQAAGADGAALRCALHIRSDPRRLAPLEQKAWRHLLGILQE